MDYAKTVVNPNRQVAKRSTIRGFKDDYYHLDADVVVLAGETHLYRKPVSNRSHSRVADTQPNIPILKGAMRFSEEPSRTRFATMVVHSFIFTPKNPWPRRNSRQSHAGTERTERQLLVDGSVHASWGL